MKKILLLFVCVLLLYCSCYKASNTNLNSLLTFDIFTGPGSYGGAGNNIKDSIITLSITDSAVSYIYFGFSLISGSPGNFPITCSLSGLPSGIIDTPGSFTFKLNYNVSFKISANIDTGIYTAYLNVSDSLGQNAYPIRIHVTPPPANSGYDGNYSGYDSCGYFSHDSVLSIYDASISTAAGNPYQIWIYNFSGNYYVYANIIGTCPSAIIRIPLQASSGGTSSTVIYGTGHSTPGPGTNQVIIDINDTIINTGDTQTCNTQLTTIL